MNNIRRLRPEKRLLTPEQHEWLVKNVTDQSRKAVCEQLNATFGTALTEKQMHSYLKNHHIGVGRDTRFKPGVAAYHPPKGVRMSQATEFKPGNRPVNWKPVGSERISKDGYVEVKVAEPRTWRQKHVVIWEQLHGPRPKGYAVIFADGNKLNLVSDNLLLVTRHTLLVLNRLGLLYKNADLTRSGVAIAELIAEIENRQKDGEKHVQTRKQSILQE